jgi:hypothetical protein
MHPTNSILSTYQGVKIMPQSTSNLKAAIALLTEQQNNLTAYLTALGLLGNQKTLAQLKADFTLVFNQVLGTYQNLKSNAEITSATFAKIENKLDLLTDNYQTEKNRYDRFVARQKELTNLNTILTTKKQNLTTAFTQTKADIKAKIDTISQNITTANTKLVQESNPDVKNGIQKEINGYLIELQNTQNLLNVKISDYQKNSTLLTGQITKNSADLQQLTNTDIPAQQKVLTDGEKRLNDTKSLYIQQQ